jgi:hypothetical protein
MMALRERCQQPRLPLSASILARIRFARRLPPRQRLGAGSGFGLLARDRAETRQQSGRSE